MKWDSKNKPDPSKSKRIMRVYVYVAGGFHGQPIDFTNVF